MEHRGRDALQVINDILNAYVYVLGIFFFKKWDKLRIPSGNFVTERFPGTPLNILPVYYRMKSDREVKDMNTLNIADNIVRLRQERKLTQAELADFLGVTKGSVSKWENSQSMPDILMLPQLAAYFNVTVDELIGYEPQLSQEQIKIIYKKLCSGFVHKTCDEAWNEVRDYVHRYYSCFEFMVQIAVLYINHYTISNENNTSERLLKEACDICNNVIENCTEVRIVNDALAMKSLCDLCMGKPEDVIEALVPVTDPYRLSLQNEQLLIQAYQMSGDMKKARSLTQITMYHQMIALISSATTYLAINAGDKNCIEETIRRIQGVIDIYEVDDLNPNVSIQFYYQSAVLYAMSEEKDKMFDMLKRYAVGIKTLFRSDIMLHGDSYFDALEQWIDDLVLGNEPVRARELVAKSATEALGNPVFMKYSAEEEFTNILKNIEREVK